jgi:L-asparaginase
VIGEERPQTLLFVATGGTISSLTPTDGGGYLPTRRATDVLEGLELGSVEIAPFEPVQSFALTIDACVRLSQMLDAQLAREDICGAVISTGTAAMEELSYLLNLLRSSDKPIVLTGAMIHKSLPGYDGTRNIVDAFRVARDPDATGRGVVVVLGGEVHAAREVQKLHRTSTVPLASWPGGPVAVVDPDGTVWSRQTSAGKSFGSVRPVEPVDLIKVAMGADGRLLRCAVETGARGLVIEGMPGGGGVTTSIMEAVLDALERRIPVVLSSRAMFGRALSISGGGSGPADIIAAGAIPARALSPAKARVLLMCALAASSDLNQIRVWFGEESR